MFAKTAVGVQRIVNCLMDVRSDNDSDADVSSSFYQSTGILIVQILAIMLTKSTPRQLLQAQKDSRSSSNDSSLFDLPIPPTETKILSITCFMSPNSGNSAVVDLICCLTSATRR